MVKQNRGTTWLVGLKDLATLDAFEHRRLLERNRSQAHLTACGQAPNKDPAKEDKGPHGARPQEKEFASRKMDGLITR